MGPQLVRCGKLAWHVMSYYVEYTFNGAATCSLRKVQYLRQPGPVRDRPSMGPQLVRCGKCDHVEGSNNTLTFNGAATCSLRKDIHHKYGQGDSCRRLQWGRNLFVAESYIPVRSPLVPPFSFNGAATCSLRKDAKHIGNQRYADAPSMGPQLVRCGKRCTDTLAETDETAFNGAATCSLRKAP